MQNDELTSLLARLCSEFDDHLSEPGVSEVFGHHAALLAPERWLALEMAYFVNGCEAVGGWLEGWSAIVEHKRIDLLLIPADLDARNGPELIDGAVRLELKLVDTGNWRQAWKDVQRDLDGRKTKRPATCSVCVVMHSVSEGPTARKRTTREKYERYFESVPCSAESFHPQDTPYDFRVVCATPERKVKWPHVVRTRWPKHYEARVRSAWVMHPHASSA